MWTLYLFLTKSTCRLIKDFYIFQNKFILTRCTIENVCHRWKLNTASSIRQKHWVGPWQNPLYRSSLVQKKSRDRRRDTLLSGTNQHIDFLSNHKRVCFKPEAQIQMEELLVLTYVCLSMSDFYLLCFTGQFYCGMD